MAELTEVFEKSNNPDELQYYWEQWYNHAGAPTRKDFEKYIALKKESALLNSNLLI